MSEIATSQHSNDSPTEFRDLNELLREFVARVTRILGADLVGAYLQGSFAVGDGDRHSDVDFLIPTQRPVTTEQEAALRSMHAEFPRRDLVWAQHLEGYCPQKDERRTLDAVGTPWLYVDNGAGELERSTHCNTAVVRWSLRESGVVLAGPDPRALVGPVNAADLRAQVLVDAKRFMPLLAGWADIDNAWTQPYVVATFCRFLHTLDAGRVTSKRQALLWGLDHLAPSGQISSSRRSTTARTRGSG